GNNGAGILLFTYYEAPAWAVDTTLELGKGFLGYGQVIGGVFDLSSNKYWMSDHMGWGNELFG
ncbi:MAG: hypothetical protein D3910_08155, partial [Candidatus Electrothrix sp. ATG2]|nr:hypothetical protein [Candidatus Electrothrix sp. ATG2]